MMKNDVDNDIRIRALYSPFRERSVNPDHFDNKMDYWCNEIPNWCKREGILKFNASDFKNSFALPGNVIPMVFGEVSNELLRRKKIIPENHLQMRYQDGSLAKKVISGLFVAPIQWTFSFLYNASGMGASIDNNYIELSNLESKCKVVQKLLEESSSVLSAAEIYQRTNKTFNSIDELNLVLKYLSMKNNIRVKELIDGVLLFKSTMNGKDIITNEDISVWRLITLQKSIESEVQDLESSIQSVHACIKDALSTGLRIKAKRDLLKKKQLEKRLQKRYAILDNIETLIMNISEAKSNMLVCDVFKGTAGSFQEILTNPAYSIDSVGEVIDHLQDLIQHKEDMDKILVLPNDDEETSELEKELDQLLLERPDDNAGCEALDLEAIGDLPNIDNLSGPAMQESHKKTLVPS